MEEVIGKKTEKIMVRPLTLDDGKEYLIRVHQDNGDKSVYLSVRFISYHPCPALIVVGDGNGQFWRVPRDEIFLAEQDI
jgi:hypothetical protein